EVHGGITSPDSYIKILLLVLKALVNYLVACPTFWNSNQMNAMNPLADLPDLQPDLQPCDPLTYRDVMGAFPTGVTVITLGRNDGFRLGVTVSSFNTVSMDPPLILWSLALKAPSLQSFREH